LQGMHHHRYACQYGVLLGDIYTRATASASAGDDHMEAGMLLAHGWGPIMGAF